jgi:hypothetical protein
VSDDQHVQQKQLERVLAESDEPADVTQERGMEVSLPPDRTRQFTHTSFSRMRTTWAGDDAVRIGEITAVTNEIIQDQFRVAFAIVERIHRHVRTPRLDTDTGELLHYPDNTPMWELDELGAPVENWGLLGDRDRETLLGTINLFLFEWELLAVDRWAEAMYSKVQWEERFAKGFTALPGMQITGKPTIDDRTHWGHLHSADERYFAVFQSVLSRKADAIIRSMIRLQRLLEGTTIR